MWRLFQGIPRVFRQQFGSVRSAPQSICHEEENGDCDKCTTLYLSQQHKGDGCGGGATNQGEDAGESHHDGGCEWTEWCRTFRGNFWTQPHTPLEAMGWGTALVLGIQISQIWQWSSHGERDQKPTLLHRIVLNMPASKPGGVACHMRDSSACIGQDNDQIQAEDCVQQTDEVFSDSSDSVIYQDTGWIINQDYTDLVPYAAEVAINYRPPIPNQRKVVFPTLQYPHVQSVHSNQKKEDIYELYSQCEALIRNGQALSSVQSGDYKQAIESWKRAGGTEDGHFNLGLAYERGCGTRQNKLMAAQHYQHASLLGHSRSQYNLAMLYLEGRNGVPQDTARAIKLLRKAARNGLPAAQTQLGVLYTEEGPNSRRRAASWFQIAARQNDNEAQYYLGICFENGWGVIKDVVKARKWYQLAAKANHTEAMYNLAMFYEKGIGGLEQNISKALELYEEAGEAGDSQAQAAVCRLTGINFMRELTLHSAGTSKDSGLSVNVPIGRLDKKRSSASSPTLTDYMRQNMANTDCDFDLPDSDMESNEDSVHFTLGELDDDADFSIEFDPDFQGEMSERRGSNFSDELSALAGLTFETKHGLLNVPGLQYNPAQHLSTIQHSHSAHQLGTISCI